MANMNAAAVTSFDQPPHYQQFEVPQPTAGEELLVDVLAVATSAVEPLQTAAATPSACTPACAAALPVSTTRAPGRCR